MTHAVPNTPRGSWMVLCDRLWRVSALPHSARCERQFMSSAVGNWLPGWVKLGSPAADFRQQWLQVVGRATVSFTPAKFEQNANQSASTDRLDSHEWWLKRRPTYRAMDEALQLLTDTPLRRRGASSSLQESLQFQVVSLDVQHVPVNWSWSLHSASFE